MKSKKSYFSSALFIKNIKRFWPVWGGYTFIMIWLVPALLYFNVLGMFYFGGNREEVLTRSIYTTELEISLVMSVIFALICAVSMFSYLNNEKSCGFFHSLPIKREGLFITCYTTGLSFLLIPNVIIAGITMLATQSRGYTTVKEMLIWLAMTCVMQLFFYTFAVTCIMFTGRLLSAPICYVILIFFFEFVRSMVNGMFEKMFFGVNEEFIGKPEGFLGILSPTEFFMSYSRNHIVSGSREYYTIDGVGEIIAVGILASCILAAVSIIVYKQRPSEAAGDTVTIKYTRPVFRWGVAFSAMLLFTWIIISTIFAGEYFTTRLVVATVITAFLCMSIGFFAAEMILKKSFAVFKGIFREWLLISVVTIAITVIGLSAVSSNMKYVPDSSEVERVYVEFDVNNVSFSGDEIEDIAALHKMIIDSSDRCIEAYNENRNYDYRYNFTVKYAMKDGESISRGYILANTLEDILEKYNSTLDKHGEKILFYNIDENYILSYADVQIYSKMLYTVNEDEIVDEAIIEKEGLGDFQFDAQRAELFLEAVMKDVSEGYLKYSEILSDRYVFVEKNGLGGYAYFEYRSPKENSYSGLSIYFHENCPNIAEFLSSNIK